MHFFANPVIANLVCLGKQCTSPSTTRHRAPVFPAGEHRGIQLYLQMNGWAPDLVKFMSRRWLSAQFDTTRFARRCRCEGLARLAALAALLPLWTVICVQRSNSPYGAQPSGGRIKGCSTRAFLHWHSPHLYRSPLTQWSPLVSDLSLA